MICIKAYYSVKITSLALSFTDDLTWLGKSLIQQGNNNGPKTVPSGTPDITSLEL